MPDNKALTAAIAIIKDANDNPIGKMRNLRIQENYRRVEVPKGIGSIFDDEIALVKWSGTISCSFFEINYKKSGVPNAIRRMFSPNIVSQIATGNNQENFEDQAVLDDIGVTINIYKKATDLIDPNTGKITPEAIPYAIITRMFIEGDNVDISEGNVSGRDQSFRYLDPIIMESNDDD